MATPSPVQTAYDAWAPSYNSAANPTRDLDAQAMRSLLGSRRFGHLVEAGCGTGKNTPFYRARCDRLLAMDFSAEMLAQAQTRLQSAAPGNGAPVDFRTHDLTQPWPLPSGSTDAVVFNLVLEHIEQLAPVLGHAAAALRAGGLLVVSELHPFKQYQGSQARFATPEGEVRIPAFVHHVSDYVQAAQAAGLALQGLQEWRHAADAATAVPRLLTLQFTRS